jgi:hypothetical protein
VNTSNIREHMDVYGSCGQRVGVVDRVEGMSIKLSKDTPEARGEHRFIPLVWVESVDEAVHLNRPCRDVQEEWQAHPIETGDYIPSSS